MKKKKMNYRKIIMFILLIFTISIPLIFSFSKIAFNKQKTEDNKKEEINIDNKKPKEMSLSLLMVGDGIVHTTMYENFKDGDSYNFNPIFEDVKDYIKSHDLAFYNQETAFGGKELGYGGYEHPQGFNSPSEFGDTMLDIGFNLVSLANNHMLDRGEIGVINTRKYWKEKEDVIAVGSYDSVEDREKTIIKEKNGIKYALLAYTTFTNSNSTLLINKPYLLNLYDKQKVADDIAKLRDKVDILMVSMHWGNEDYNLQNSKQEEIAKYLSSLGVDIVIGHHPHVIQPIEYIDNTLVIYSLGNFISSQLDDNNLTGLMLSLKITKSLEDSKPNIMISDLLANIVYTHYDGPRNTTLNRKNHKVIPFNELTVEMLPNYKERYENTKKIITSLDKSITVAALE